MKIISIIFILTLVTSSLIIMENTSAQSTQKLSAPQFSLKYVDYSYDVPPVYGINPYNGNTEIKQSGYHVYKEYVEVWIKNPSFQQYTDASGHKIVLGYQVYWKGHYGDLWANATYPAYVLSSGSEYTVISFAFGDDANDDSHYWLSGQVSTGDQLDFKAATFVGYYNIVSVDRLPIFGSEARTYLVFTGQTSDWSSEQTILLDTSAPTVSPDSVYAPKNAYTSGNNSPTATPTPQPIATTMPTPTKTPTITPSYTPTNSNLQLNQSGIVMIIVGVVTAVVAALSLIYFKQHKNF